MKKKIIFLLGLSILFFSIYGDNVSYQIDFVSNYIWRGFDLNPDRQPALQPSLTFALKDTGLSFNVWSSISFQDKGLNELDLTINYDLKVPEDYSLAVGFTHYGWYFSNNFKFGDHTSQEIYVTGGLNKLPFNPSLSIYYDFTNGDGLYMLLSGSHSLKFDKNINADLSLSLGYNGGQWLGEMIDPGFSDINLGITVPFTIKKLSLSVFAKYTFVLLDIAPKDGYLWLGISLAGNF